MENERDYELSVKLLKAVLPSWRALGDALAIYGLTMAALRGGSVEEWIRGVFAEDRREQWIDRAMGALRIMEGAELMDRME